VRMAAAAMLAAVALVACGDEGDPQPDIALDGTPRIADTAGVVREATTEAIELDDGRRFELSEHLLAFSTINAELLPIRGTVGQLVLIGVEDDFAVWVAVVSDVVSPKGKEPAAFYQGRVVETDDERRVIFRDGTVLRLTAGLPVPLRGALLQVEIDPETAAIREWQ
jgi:hypothetical protein